MDCRDCARYDETAEACRDRKVNPLKWEDAVSVAQLLGPRAICLFSDHRERIIASRVPVGDATQFFGPQKGLRDRRR